MVAAPVLPCSARSRIRCALESSYPRTRCAAARPTSAQGNWPSRVLVGGPLHEPCRDLRRVGTADAVETPPPDRELVNEFDSSTSLEPWHRAPGAAGVRVWPRMSRLAGTSGGATRRTAFVLTMLLTDDAGARVAASFLGLEVHGSLGVVL